MKPTRSLIVFGLGFLGTIGLLSYLFLQLRTSEVKLIETLPDSPLIAQMALGQKFILGLLALVVVLAIAVLRSLLRKPTEVVKYVDRIVEIPSLRTDANAEEQGKQEQRIDELVQQIVAEIRGESVEQLGESYLLSLAHRFDMVQGIFYYIDRTGNEPNYILRATYAYYSNDDTVRSFRHGHGLPGQVALNKQLLNLQNVPSRYLTIMSGLGQSSPRFLVIFPLLYQNESIGVVELASFSAINDEAEGIIRRTAEHLAERCQALESR